MEPTYGLAKAILKPSLGIWFRWHIEGLANVPREGPVILAFNHIAYLDPLAAAYVVDKSGRRPRFLAKSELFADKRIAWILKGAKQIEVRRGTAAAPMALDHAIAALDAGEVVVIFPEGTITTDAQLEPMAAKSGIARLALATGAPVIPCALWGTANVWGKGYAKRWWPGQDICVRIGDPMQLSGDMHDPAAWADVGATVMTEIGRLLASLRPVVPDRRRPSKKAAA
ncbi:MAG TPA: lysophospholipid acyltransferase family protein [Actinomycetota bacterium]|nr:lysophospholipid acyltransferase family protein [Actinomycetota bacterium]